MSILILIMGTLAIFRTPTDIFPNINIPVVSIIWSYNGLIPEDMSDRIVSVTERALTTTVDNIEHIESQSLYGIAVVLRKRGRKMTGRRISCSVYVPQKI